MNEWNLDKTLIAGWVAMGIMLIMLGFGVWAYEGVARAKLRRECGEPDAEWDRHNIVGKVGVIAMVVFQGVLAIPAGIWYLIERRRAKRGG